VNFAVTSNKAAPTDENLCKLQGKYSSFDLERSK